MKLSNNSRPDQSIDIVDPEGSCKEANIEPDYQLIIKALREEIKFLQVNLHYCQIKIMRLEGDLEEEQ